jgi:ABC-type branched-subunit amino acid transport system substrate-binding protein
MWRIVIFSLCLCVTVGASSSALTPSAVVSPGAGILYNITYCDQPYTNIASDDILRVGVMYSATGAFASFGIQTRKLAVSWLNDLLPEGYIGTTIKRVMLMLCDVASTDSIAVTCATQMIASHVAAVIGPESLITVTIMSQFEAARISVVSPITTLSIAFICDATLQAPCTKRGQRRFQYLYGTQPLAGDIMRDYMNIMKNQGITNIGIVEYPDTFNQEVTSTVRRDAPVNSINVVYDKTIKLPYDGQDRDATILALKALNPDGIVYSNRANCTETILLFKKHKFYPKSLMTVQCVDMAFRTQVEDVTNSPPVTFNHGAMRYVMGATGWDARVRGPDYQEDKFQGYCDHFTHSRNASAVDVSQELNSPAIFRDYFVRLTNIEPTYSHSGIMMSFYLIEAAVAISNSTNPSAVHDAIRDIYLPTFNGRLVVDVYGLVRGSSIVYYQVGFSGNLEIVSPPSAQTAALLFPAPSYDERTFVEVKFSTREEKVAIALVIIGEVYLLLIFVGLILLRKHEAIRAASWGYSAMTVFGAVILMFSILSWTLNNIDAQCQSRIPLIFIGYSTILGGMFAGVYRIHKIFNTKVLKQVSITPVRLLLVLCAVLCPMYLLFFICVGAFPMYRVEYFPHPESIAAVARPNQNYTDCAIDSGSKIIFYLLLAGAVMLTVYVDQLARRTRGVKELFNSSIEIRNSLFRFFICIGVVIALVWSGATKDNRSADFTVRSIFIYLACVSTVHSLYFDKVWKAFTGDVLQWDTDSKIQQNHTHVQNTGMADNGEDNASLIHQPPKSSVKASSYRAPTSSPQHHVMSIRIQPQNSVNSLPQASKEQTTPSVIGTPGKFPIVAQILESPVSTGIATNKATLPNSLLGDNA